MIALGNRMGAIVGLVRRPAGRHLGHLLINEGLVHLEGRDHDGDRLVRAELVIGLRRDDQTEREVLALLHGGRRHSRRRECRRQAGLVDRGGHEVLDRLRLDDGGEILDAHGLVGDLRDDLALLRSQVHLRSEHALSLILRTGNIFGICNHIELHATVFELLLNLHVSFSLMTMRLM